MIWKSTAASVTGRSHLDLGESGQDYSRAGSIRIGDREYFIGLAADGAGSTTNGGRGAEIACETAYTSIIGALRRDIPLSAITDDEVRRWITTSRDAIAAEAAASGKRLKEYACTFLGSVAGNDHTLFFQIGDGAIVVNTDADYRTIFWPEQGEYANTTFFVSDEAYLERLRILHPFHSQGDRPLHRRPAEPCTLVCAEEGPHRVLPAPFRGAPQGPGQ
jgi:hypothetical protein